MPTENNSPLPHVLYLLQFPAINCLKIGITRNLWGRVGELRVCWGDVDIKASCVIAGERAVIRELERILHGNLEKFSVEPPHRLGGWTEMFQPRALDTALKLVRELGHTPHSIAGWMLTRCGWVRFAELMPARCN